MYHIKHDRNLNTDAGYVGLTLTPFPKVNSDGGAAAIDVGTASEWEKKFKINLRTEDGKTLLSLLYWVTYTWDGRQLCRENQAGRKGSTRREADRPTHPLKTDNPYYDDETIKANLRPEFREYVGDGPLLDSLISAHIAAGYWTAYDQGKQNDSLKLGKDHWGAVYQQHMSFILWTLWENFQDHLFSMDW